MTIFLIALFLTNLNRELYFKIFTKIKRNEKQKKNKEKYTSILESNSLPLMTDYTFISKAFNL